MSTETISLDKKVYEVLGERKKTNTELITDLPLTGTDGTHTSLNRKRGYTKSISSIFGDTSVTGDLPWFKNQQKEVKLDTKSVTAIPHVSLDYGISDEMVEVVKGILKDTNFSAATVNISQGETYLSIKVENNSLTRKVVGMEKKQFMYKYYSYIWTFCALLLGVFVTSGVSGLLGPLSAFTGSILSITGIIGAVIDWKGWNRKNAF